MPERMAAIFDANRAVFLSYAHADNDSSDPKARWLDRFVQFLQPLIRQQDLTVWSDQEIKVGERWHERIQSQLEHARAVVLLVSPAFLASDYIANNELPVLLKNAAQRGVAILPVILSPCLYEETKFKYPDPKQGPNEFTLASIQWANPPSKTLVEMEEGEQNRVLLKVAKELAALLRQDPLPGTPPSAASDDAGPDELQPRAATVLFDEAHGQERWFRLRPTVDKGFGRLKAITEQRFAVATLARGQKFSTATLRGSRALVLAVGPEKTTLLADDEIAAVHEFVRHGGGLLVMGTYTGDWHHEANLNRLLEEYGIAFNRDVVTNRADEGFTQGGERSPNSRCTVVACPGAGQDQPAIAALAAALLAGVSVVGTLSSCSLYVQEDLALPLLQSGQESLVLEPVPEGQGIRIQEYRQTRPGPAVLAAASKTGRVVVVGAWKMFLDGFIDDPQRQNGKFFENLLAWLTTASVADTAGRPPQSNPPPTG